jgi:hypothetical protein
MTKFFYDKETLLKEGHTCWISDIDGKINISENIFPF